MSRSARPGRTGTPGARIRRGRAAAFIGLGAAALLAVAACGPVDLAAGPAAAFGSQVTAAGAGVQSRVAVSVPPLQTPPGISVSGTSAPHATAPDPTTGSDATGASNPPASPGPSTATDPTTAPTPPPPSPAKPAAPAARITTDLGSGTGLNPTHPITVHVTDGTLTTVRLSNPAEHLTVAGTLSADRHSWTSTQVLGYGKDYLLSANAVNADGTGSTSNIDFSTLRPANQTMPYFQTINGDPLQQGGTFGVGMVVVVHFDEPIADRAAAEKALHVTTSPHVAGAWTWADDQDVHYRPRDFWAPGTEVTVAADVYGVRVGQGLYGQSDASTSFTIGRRQVTYAYDNAPDAVDKVIVKNASGAVLRTMNTSMGAHGGETVGNRYINFYTMSGTYTVIAHENPAIMSSASYGLPADAPGGYPPEKIPWSTRISTDGIYLHELNNTIWAQNSGQDVSHGCLNLDTANATWFFQHSLIGDPVIIAGAKGAPKIQLWQGGDWSVPWSAWVAGSALH